MAAFKEAQAVAVSIVRYDCDSSLSIVEARGHYARALHPRHFHQYRRWNIQRNVNVLISTDDRWTVSGLFRLD